MIAIEGLHVTEGGGRLRRLLGPQPANWVITHWWSLGATQACLHLPARSAQPILIKHPVVGFSTFVGGIFWSGSSISFNMIQTTMKPNVLVPSYPCPPHKKSIGSKHSIPDSILLLLFEIVYQRPPNTEGGA